MASSIPEDCEINFSSTRIKDRCRMDSISLEEGKEGQHLDPKDFTAYRGRAMAVFTSGGDSQGMNAAVRAVVRMGLYVGCTVYTIREGYQGMVDGGDENIVKIQWSDVSGIIEKGGTIVGSARCAEFRERAGRLRAARNLVERSILNIVCIGGDGSLTGADTFRKEWPGLLSELLDTGSITQEQSDSCQYLNIVGLVGSIDNDFCGTDMTIGTDTALHRIVEAVDAIGTTAASHQRAFVLEVMGRHCGYLALVGALATEADFVFIPEHPPEVDWPEKLCKKLSEERRLGQRLNVILVAEGATDLDGNPINVQDVKNVIKERLKYDTRITVLGHVQRGGNPSTFDRTLASRMGAEAVLALMEAKEDSPPLVICLHGNQMVRKSLVDCVAKTRSVGEAMKEKKYTNTVSIRGRSFASNLMMYKVLAGLAPPTTPIGDTKGQVPKNLAVVMVGAPACGANAAARSFVRMCLEDGFTVYRVNNSMKGLSEGDIKLIEWNDVTGWAGEGGSNLGTKRALPSQVGLAKIAAQLEKFKISGLLIIGGFEAFNTAVEFESAQKDYPALNIPVVVIPSTISNNVPGTDFSLGCDTSLNEITRICDRIKQSASGSKHRVFVVETMGGYCGYLATLSALAGGADSAYIYEEPFTIEDIQKNVAVLKKKMQACEVKRGLILVCENANANYDCSFIYKLYSEEGKGLYTTRMNILGHMQQGGSPSPFDRNMGTKMGLKSAEYIMEKVRQFPTSADDGRSPQKAVLLGVIKRQTTFSSVTKLADNVDFEHRLPKNPWWLSLRPLLRIFAKHQDNLTYTGNAEDDTGATSVNENHGNQTNSTPP